MSDQNPFPGEKNTGHVWDDSLRELLNDPPNWWRIGFHASWIVVLCYGLVYPMWPTLTGHTKGYMGWTSIGEFKEEIAAIEEIRAPFENKLKGMTAAQILADDEMKNYVSKSAKVLFGDNCSACHGGGGQGNPGYPVLADDDWLYGGNVEAIQASITNGRQGNMPARGLAGNLNDQEIDDLSKHVVAMGEGGGHAAGKALYNGKGGCMACHGPDAKGMHALGSANLTDGILRFVGDPYESVKYTITHGVNHAADAETRNAVMPKFGDSKLTTTDITKLAVYVHMLGGGQ